MCPEKELFVVTESITESQRLFLIEGFLIENISGLGMVLHPEIEGKTTLEMELEPSPQKCLDIVPRRVDFMLAVWDCCRF